MIILRTNLFSDSEKENEKKKKRKRIALGVGAGLGAAALLGYGIHKGIQKRVAPVKALAKREIEEADRAYRETAKKVALNRIAKDEKSNHVRQIHENIDNKISQAWDIAKNPNVNQADLEKLQGIFKDINGNIDSLPKL